MRLMKKINLFQNTHVPLQKWNYHSLLSQLEYKNKHLITGNDFFFNTLNRKKKFVRDEEYYKNIKHKITIQYYFTCTKNSLPWKFRQVQIQFNQTSDNQSTDEKSQ